MSNIPYLDLDDDLVITQATRRAGVGGTWICGTIHRHRFNALVFPEHAKVSGYEINDSRISKLWVQRLADNVTVYNWDRGMDLQPANPRVAAIVDLLEARLAEYAYGPLLDVRCANTQVD